MVFLFCLNEKVCVVLWWWIAFMFLLRVREIGRRKSWFFLFDSLTTKLPVYWAHCFSFDSTWKRSTRCISFVWNGRPIVNHLKFFVCIENGEILWWNKNVRLSTFASFYFIGRNILFSFTLKNDVNDRHFVETGRLSAGHTKWTNPRSKYQYKIWIFPFPILIAYRRISKSQQFLFHHSIPDIIAPNTQLLYWSVSTMF